MTENTNDSETLTKVIAMMRSREQVGLSKYGISLDRKDLNAREWLTHMLEELLDGACYAVRTLETLPETTRSRASVSHVEDIFTYPTIGEGQKRGQRIREDQYAEGSFKRTYAEGYNDGLTDSKPEDVAMYRALREIVESIRGVGPQQGTITTPGYIANIASVALSTLPPDTMNSYDRYDELKLDAERYRTVIRLGDMGIDPLSEDQASIHLTIPDSLPDGYDNLDQLIDAITEEEQNEFLAANKETK